MYDTRFIPALRRRIRAIRTARDVADLTLDLFLLWAPPLLWVAIVAGLCALVGCDSSASLPAPERAAVECEAEAILDAIEAPELPAPRRVDDEATAPVRTGNPVPLDPCDLYGDDPGVTLTNDTAHPGKEVLVADYCIGAIPNIEGCYVSDHVVDLGDIELETDLVDLWCDFTCDDGTVTIEYVAGYPAPGNDMRVEWSNPCPVEVAP